MVRTHHFKGRRVSVAKDAWKGVAFVLLTAAAGLWERNPVLLGAAAGLLVFGGIFLFALSTIRIPSLTIGPEILVWGGNHLPLGTLEVGPIARQPVGKSHELAFLLRGPNVYGRMHELFVEAQHWPHFEEMHQEISQAVAARKALDARLSQPVSR